MYFLLKNGDIPASYVVVYQRVAVIGRENYGTLAHISQGNLKVKYFVHLAR